MKWKWGNVPVPIQFLAGLLLGAILQVIFPRFLFSDGQVGDVVGIAIVGTGVAVVIWSVAAAGAVDIESPQRLISSGPYARSRNPMMGAWTLIFLGITLIVNSAWMAALLVVVVLITHLVDIPAEERFLEKEFGDEYLDYRRRVRRYI